jgi:PadR family transcriptional regulator, regulatory protein AphA
LYPPAFRDDVLVSLRHALLALLAAQPMSGYDLVKRFDQSVAYVWHAPHSQIYPELRKLEIGGLITAESQPRGRAVKRTYSITDEGLAELRRWVEELNPLQRERDAAYLKATYFEFTSFEGARRQFLAHQAHYEQQLSQWEAHVKQLENRDTDLLRRRLAISPESLHDAIVAYKVHVYRGLIERARIEVEWARKGQALVDDLEAKAATADNTEKK